MRVVLDTSVVISGIFFGGLPGQLLRAWAHGGFELILSPRIFEEYQRVCERLGAAKPGLRYRAVLGTMIGGATMVSDPEDGTPVTADPDDDMFMRVAHAARAVVVSGDSDLLDASGWRGVEVLTPRALVDQLGLMP